MKTPEQVLADVRRRLASSWHVTVAADELTCCDIDAAPVIGVVPRYVEVRPIDTPVGVVSAEAAPRQVRAAWPHAFPLGVASKAVLERDFADQQRAALTWRDWAAARQLRLIDTPRLVHGTNQRMPTHLAVPDVDAAALLCGSDWTALVNRSRHRAAALHHQFPRTTATVPDLARLVRAVDDYSPVDFELLCAAGHWFEVHGAAGLTPRQVPIPGLHAKWLNNRHALVATLAGVDSLGLLPRHPPRLHFTYLDPTHRAVGARLHDSTTVGDPMTPAYLPGVVIISENKDTAIHFPELPGGISIEGAGHGGATAAAIDWLRACPQRFYWGDMDVAGLEILNDYRAAGLSIASILMDIPTFDQFARFGTSSDAGGKALGVSARRNLTYLTEAELGLYDRLTDPGWTGHRRVEQERIPLHVALAAVQRQLRLANSSAAD